MSTETLIEQVRQLKNALVEIDKPLATRDLPPVVLEDFKMAVDHTRLTVWAVLSAGQVDQIGPAIIRFRLKRAAEMCQQIKLDIEAGQIGADSSDLKTFQDTLKSTNDRIDQLYRPGM